MNQFETHVYATVRVKVLGTNFSANPQELASQVADAVCAAPSEWFRPVHGTVSVPNQGSFNIGCVEFADGIHGVLVDEINQETGYVVKSYDFDEACEPLKDRSKEAAVIQEVLQLLTTLPEAAVGNSKVHYAVMKLKGLAA